MSFLDLEKQNSAPPRPVPGVRTRVAVLGGGLGALVAVYELLASPGASERYDITVYAMGHRLGGKCASGRDVAVANRVLEHGLHVWFGCYHQSFRFLQQLYSELPTDTAFERDWQKIFKPQRSVELWDPLPSGWSVWALEFPDNPLIPGQHTPLDDMPALVRALGRWLRTFFDMTLVPQEHRHSVRHAVRVLVANLFRGGVTTLLALVDRGIERLISGKPAPLIQEIRRRLATAWQEAPPDEGLRRFWIMVDLALTVLTGIAQDRVLQQGLETLDPLDFRAWLARHGASRLTLEAAPLRVMYDMMFAYEQGDRRRPNASAGTMLSCILRMLFSYAGSFSYKMQTGMGDAVLGPLYEVLQSKGVRFQFFHRVERLEPATDGREISRITLLQQATLRGDHYDPFIQVQGRSCWPETPRTEQLVENLSGANLERPSDPWPGVRTIVLEYKRDFDEVILGIPVGALHRIAAPLAAVRPEWRRMLDGLGTVATISTQLWMRQDPQFLRPDSPRAAARAPLIGGYTGLFDTWADMSHIAAAEDWPEAPAAVFYGCAPFPDGEAADCSLLVSFLERHGPVLWPGAGANFDPERLVDLADRRGNARVEAQYLRLNHEGSDRYVQSLAGSSAFRLAPDASGFRNLWLAGDWTRTEFNLGSVESTVRSAMACARGLTIRVAS